MKEFFNKTIYFLTENRIYVAIFFTLLILILLKKMNNSKKSTEEFKTILDDVIIMDKCKDMTPIQLFKLFDNDLDKMTRSVIQVGVSVDELSKKENYPKIATLLYENKIITCD